MSSSGSGHGFAAEREGFRRGGDMYKGRKLGVSIYGVRMPTGAGGGG